MKRQISFAETESAGKKRVTRRQRFLDEMERSRSRRRSSGMSESKVRKPTGRRYSDEVQERAVRMVFEHQHEYGTPGAAIRSIAAKMGMSQETLHMWVNQAESDRSQRPGATTAELALLKELGRENRELRTANEILRKASADSTGRRNTFDRGGVYGATSEVAGEWKMGKHDRKPPGKTQKELRRQAAARAVENTVDDNGDPDAIEKWGALLKQQRLQAYSSVSLLPSARDVRGAFSDLWTTGCIDERLNFVSGQEHEQWLVEAFHRTRSINDADQSRGVKRVIQRSSTGMA
ncbi:transposase, partial [Burkholderia stagnalis]